MELVYLWVKEYKNIYHQGFNFSPRFKCDYDEDTNKLTVDEKKDYVSIFPKNINITAIVGENGSGKSSLLVGITNHLAIFQVGNKYYSRGFDIDKISAPISVEESSIELGKQIIYLDFDLMKINPIRDDWDYAKLNIYDKNLYNKVKNDTVGDSSFNIYKFQENFYNLIVEYEESFTLDKLFFFNPIKISLSDYIYKHQDKDNKFDYINKLIGEVESSVCTKEKFLTFLYSQLCMVHSLDMTKIETNILSIEDEIIKKSDYLELGNVEIIYKLFNDLSTISDKKNINIIGFRKIYLDNKNAFLKIIAKGYLSINLIDENEREYFDLSQGERKLFTEFLMIYDAIKTLDKQDIFIVLDEPDLTLHPDWQKKYTSELIGLLSNFTEKNFHIIITSHSPFVLSDLPKENVIFLEKGIQKYPFKDKQTFGANIHTLLSDGFFMSDGLMGEFAKGKIEEIKKFYELVKKFEKKEKLKSHLINLNKKQKVKIKKLYKRKKLRFEHIQSIIGEPFLKTIMKNYLDELDILFYGKKEFLKKEILRLQELQKNLND